MPRTFTGPERTAVGGATLASFGKLEITDPDGAWRDVSTGLNGIDWFDALTLTENQDDSAMQLSGKLLKEAGTLSLAPFRTDSLVNRNGAGAYAPMLDLWRKWRASTAVLPAGSTPSGTDWKGIGEGRMDIIETSGEEIQLTGRSEEAVLLDKWIDTERQYGSIGGIAMETVIQSMIDDNGFAGIYTLYCPVSPGFLMNTWTQPKGNLFPALKAVADKAGMVLRFRYDAANTYRLTLFKPNRTASVEDWSLGPTEYRSVAINKIDKSGIRNFIKLRYVDPVLGTQTVISPWMAGVGTVVCAAGAATFSNSQAGVLQNGTNIIVGGIAYTVSAFNGTTGCTLLSQLATGGVPTFAASAFTASGTLSGAGTSASILSFGRVDLEIDLAYTTQVNTGTKAQGMADAIRSDTEFSNLEQQFETLGFWFIQLHDYGKFLANGVNYNADQFGGVTSIQQSMANGEVKTLLGARGKPAGGYTTWRVLGTGTVPGGGSGGGAAPPPAPPKPPTLTHSFDWHGQLILNVIGDEKTVSLKYAVSSVGLPTATTVRGTTAILQQSITGITTGIYVQPGHSVYVAAFAYSASGSESTPMATAILARQGGALDTAYLLPGHIIQEELVRGGDGGYGTPLSVIRATPIYSSDGGTPLIDTIARRFQTALGGPTGIGGDIIERGGNKGDQAIDSGISVVAGAIDFVRSFVNKHLGNVPDDGTSDRRAATLNQKTGGDRGFGTIDSGNIVVAGGADFSRAYTGKHLGNIPDDGTSDRRAATANQKTGGDRGFTAIDSGNVAVASAVDFARGYTGKSLANVPDDVTSDRRAATGNQKTGGDRGFSAIDSGNLVIAAAVDFARSFLNKHLGNIPDDASSDRRAVTLVQRSAATRADTALDGSSKLQTGVTAAATAADGNAGIESQRTATAKDARSAGTAASGITGEESVRGGEAGYAVPGAAYSAQTQMDATGSVAMVDPFAMRFLNSTIDPTVVLDNPTGILGAGAQQTLAGVARSLAKGYQSGFARDGDVITFSPVYQNSPQVLIHGGILFDNGLGTTAIQYEDFAAVGLTASGFTVRAKIKKKGTITARTAEFTASLTATSVGGVTGNATLASDPSNDNNYKARFRVDVVCSTVSGAGTTTIVVAIEVSADGSTGWTEYATRSFSASRTTPGTTTNTYSGNEVTVNVAGLTNVNAAVRLKYKSRTNTGNAAPGTTQTVTGYNNTGGGADAGHGVTYNTTSGDTINNKTPAADDYVTWESFEVVS